MKILLRNLRDLPYSLDVGDFQGFGDMVRELLAPYGSPGDTVDIGERVNPWELNVQRFIRRLVVPQGSTRVITTLAGGYRVTATPAGQCSATFLEDPDDLVFLFFGGGGGGLTPADHQRLRQLIHFIDEGPAGGFTSGAYKETVGGVFPTSVTWYEDATKTKKIVEKTITRSGGGATNVKPTPIVWRMYATDGTTVIETTSDAVTYSGAFEVSRTRTIT